jgi:CBS domain-containing protein
MPIETLIQRPVETLPPDATCAEAAELMRDECIGAVVVADGNRPLGMVTDRDLAIRLVAEREDPEKILLRDVMSGEPIFLSGTRGVSQVIRAMRDFSIRRVMLVDEAGELLGVVSMDDILILLGEQLADLAEAIRGEIEPPE